MLVQASFNEKSIATQRKNVSQVICTDYQESVTIRQSDPYVISCRMVP